MSNADSQHQIMQSVARRIGAAHDGDHRGAHRSDGEPAHVRCRVPRRVMRGDGEDMIAVGHRRIGHRRDARLGAAVEVAVHRRGVRTRHERERKRRAPGPLVIVTDGGVMSGTATIVILERTIERGDAVHERAGEVVRGQSLVCAALPIATEFPVVVNSATSDVTSIVRRQADRDGCSGDGPDGIHRGTGCWRGGMRTP